MADYFTPVIGFLGTLVGATAATAGQYLVQREQVRRAREEQKASRKGEKAHRLLELFKELDSQLTVLITYANTRLAQGGGVLLQADSAEHEREVPIRQIEQRMSALRLEPGIEEVAQCFETVLEENQSYLASRDSSRVQRPTETVLEQRRRTLGHLRQAAIACRTAMREALRRLEDID